jgi:hypothetical protein
LNFEVEVGAPGHKTVIINVSDEWIRVCRWILQLWLSVQARLW